MDAMRQSRKFAATSWFSMIWNLLLLVPHSFALVLALPTVVTAQCELHRFLGQPPAAACRLPCLT